MVIDNVTFNTYDLGGHVQARRLWRSYLPEVDAIVYIVDSADQARFKEARTELDVSLSL